MVRHSVQQSIVDVIPSAILAAKIRTGTRLGESEVAQMFGVSRTRVREAMLRSEAGSVVQASPRRGWFVIEPSVEDVRIIDQVRRVVEVGRLNTIPEIPPDAVRTLRAHIGREGEALASGHVPGAIALLGNFQTRLAEIFGNGLLVKILRDLTVRITLISMLYNSRARARGSSCQHCGIVDALEAGEFARAGQVMDSTFGPSKPGWISPRTLTRWPGSRPPCPWRDVRTTAVPNRRAHTPLPKRQSGVTT